jgi:hypothetical protein
MESAEQAVLDLQNLVIHRKVRIWRPFMEKYNCQHVLEIGVRTGTNFMRMIEHTPRVAVAIDSFINDGTVAHNDAGYAQEELNAQYDAFVKAMADKPFVQIYREYSHLAVQRFPDCYFDLAYIDADHSYAGCLQDITDWYPKMKVGGFLLGDDYKHGRMKIGMRFEVIEAVTAFAQAHGLTVFELPRAGWGVIRQ